MADMITRCPKCAMAFHISDTLLKSAKGIVRCGSCLSIFDARDYLEQTLSSSPTGVSAATSAAKTTTDEDLGEVADDEAWALELLKDDDSEQNIQLKKIIPAKTESAPPPVAAEPVSTQKTAAAPISTSADTDKIAAAPASDATETPVRADPPYAQSLYEDPLYVEPQHSQALGTPESDTPKGIDTTADTEKKGAEAADTAPETSDVPAPKPEAQSALPAPAPTSPVPGSSKPAIRDMIATLEPDPLEVNWRQPESWLRRLLWPALALAALLVLVVQVAWLEFDQLSRKEPYRGLYSLACRHLGCHLPDLIDRNQIHTGNLLVRSHPEIANTLLVDVILQNNAPFEQPFPSLLLIFTDLNNAVVAEQRLPPSEYLGGELIGQDLMPIRQPIYIALELPDPGPAAISYHIRIVD